MQLTIPAVYRFLWSGTSFPPLYAVAVSSVLVADPHARIVIHCFGSRPRDEAFHRMTSDPRVTVAHTDIDQVFSDLPPHLRRIRDVYVALPHAALSAKSNILRYAILYLEGGIYLDFDTITLRPLDSLSTAPCFVGTERVWSLDERRVAGDSAVLRSRAGLAWLAIWTAKRLDSAATKGRLRVAERTRRLNARYTHIQPNNAVIGAVAGADFLDRLLRAAHGTNPFIRYSTGPTLLAKVAHGSSHLVDVLPPEFFYQIEPAESYRYFEDKTLELHPSAAVIHYVGSNSQRFLRTEDAPHGSLIQRVVDLVRAAETDSVDTPTTATTPSDEGALN